MSNPALDLWGCHKYSAVQCSNAAQNYPDPVDILYILDINFIYCIHIEQRDGGKVYFMFLFYLN